PGSTRRRSTPRRKRTLRRHRSSNRRRQPTPPLPSRRRPPPRRRRQRQKRRLVDPCPRSLVKKMQVLWIEIQRDRCADLRQLPGRDTSDDLVLAAAGIHEHFVADWFDQIERELRSRSDADMLGPHVEDHRALFRGPAERYA